MVVAALIVALISFFIGTGPGNPNLDPTATIPAVFTTESGTISRYGFLKCLRSFSLRLQVLQQD